MREYSIDFDDVSSKMLLFDAFKGLDGRYNIKIEKYKEKRSSPQNKYFHSVILPYIANEIGDLEINVKEDLKGMFLAVHEEKYGQQITKVRSTASLTTLEFEKFCEDCRLWALGFLGINIPLPNEVINE